MKTNKYQLDYGTEKRNVQLKIDEVFAEKVIAEYSALICHPYRGVFHAHTAKIYQSFRSRFYTLNVENFI